MFVPVFSHDNQLSLQMSNGVTTRPPTAAELAKTLEMANSSAFRMLLLEPVADEQLYTEMAKLLLRSRNQEVSTEAVAAAEAEIQEVLAVLRSFLQG